MTNQGSAAAGPHSHRSTDSRESESLSREVGEIRGEPRVLEWACGVAVVAILGGMGVLYQNQQALGRGVQEVREDVGRIDERTIHLGERMDRFHARLGNIEDLLQVLVARVPAKP